MSPRPKYFYVVGQLSDFAPALVRGYFEGLTGVSDTPEILNEFLWLRGTGLAMPTNELLEDNESPLVCQIDYDDPDALAADNLRLFSRLFNNEGDVSMAITKLRDKLSASFDQQAIEHGFNKWDYEQSVETLMPGNLKYQMDYGGLPGSKIGRGLESGEIPPIEGVEDLARLFWDGMFASEYGGKTKSAREIVEEMRDSKQPTRRSDREEYGYEDFLKAVKRALVVGSAYYSNEGEWLVQQPRMNIPEGTILILKKPARDGYKSTWTYESWREHPYQGDKVEFFESFGILPDEPYSLRDVVSALGLEDKYDIRWVETSAVEGKRDRRAPRLHDRLAAAKTRVFNPSLDAEFWGEQGAGAYLVAEDTGRVLLTLRSAQVNEPGTWGIPGGAIDADESPAAAARREIEEELGYDGDIEFDLLPAFSKGSFVYHNHIAQVSEEFEPVLDWENDDYGWFYLEDLEELDLHPGVRWMLEQGGLG